MEFKTVREGFDWLKVNRQARNDMECWADIIWYIDKRLGRYADEPAEKAALARARKLCQQWRQSGNPPTSKARSDLEQFTNCDAAPLLRAVSKYCSDPQLINQPVPHFNYRS